jgi:hypothetical protein
MHSPQGIRYVDGAPVTCDYRPRCDPVNDFLVTYLDTIDERLLDYLDEDDDELPLALVARLRGITSALLDGGLTPAQVTGEWVDYFALSGAFVAAYGSEDLEARELAAPFLRQDEGAETSLTEADRHYLLALELELDGYPEMRRR